MHECNAHIDFISIYILKCWDITRLARHVCVQSTHDVVPSALPDRAPGPRRVGGALCCGTVLM
jgi:hypothetical protein